MPKPIRKTGLPKAIALLTVVTLVMFSSCDFDSEEHTYGPFFGFAPHPAGDPWTRIEVNASMRDGDIVDYGYIGGWIEADGCVVALEVCDRGYCELFFNDFVAPGEEVDWYVDSDMSQVLSDFIDYFPNCVETGRGCVLGCDGNSNHDFNVYLQSACPASVEFYFHIVMYPDDEY